MVYGGVRDRAFEQPHGASKDVFESCPVKNGHSTSIAPCQLGVVIIFWGFVLKHALLTFKGFWLTPGVSGVSEHNALQIVED